MHSSEGMQRLLTEARQRKARAAPRRMDARYTFPISENTVPANLAYERELFFSAYELTEDDDRTFYVPPWFAYVYQTGEVTQQLVRAYFQDRPQIMLRRTDVDLVMRSANYYRRAFIETNQEKLQAFMRDLLEKGCERFGIPLPNEGESVLRACRALDKALDYNRQIAFFLDASEDNRLVVSTNSTAEDPFATDVRIWTTQASLFQGGVRSGSLLLGLPPRPFSHGFITAFKSKNNRVWFVEKAATANPVRLVLYTEDIHNKLTSSVPADDVDQRLQQLNETQPEQRRGLEDLKETLDPTSSVFYQLCALWKANLRGQRPGAVPEQNTEPYTLFEKPDGTALVEGQQFLNSPTRKVVYVPGRNELAFVYGNNNIGVLNISTGVRSAQFQIAEGQFDRQIIDFAFDSTGNRVAFCYNKTVEIHTRGSPAIRWLEHTQNVSSVMWADGDTHLVFNSFNRIGKWNLEGTERRIFDTAHRFSYGSFLSADGDYIIAISRADGEIYRYENCRFGEFEQCMAESGARNSLKKGWCASVTSDGNFVAFVGKPFLGPNQEYLQFGMWPDPQNPAADEKSGKVFRTTGDVNAFFDIALSPNGSLVAGLYDSDFFGSTLEVFELGSTKSILKVQQIPHFVRNIAFSPDSKQISWKTETKVMARNIVSPHIRTEFIFRGNAQAEHRDENGRYKVRKHDAIDTMIAYSPDGQYIAHALGSEVHVRDATTLKLHRVLDQPWLVGSINFAWDGAMLGIASHEGANIRTYATGNWEYEGTSTCNPPEADDRMIVHSPNNQYFAVAYTRARQVQMYNAVTGQRLTFRRLDQELDHLDLNDEFGDEFGNIEAMEFSPDSQKLAIGGRRGGVKIYSRENGSFIMYLHDAYVKAIVWSPDGQKLLTKGQSGAMLEELEIKITGLYGANAGTVHFRIVDDDALGVPLCFSPDGKLFAKREHFIDNEYAITVWNVNGHKEKSWKMPWTDSVSFSNDGSRVVTLSVDHNDMPFLQTTQIKEAQTVTIFDDMRTMTAKPASMAVSPDGKLLAVTGANDERVNNIRVYNATTGDWVTSLPGQFREYATGMTFIDNNTIVTGSGWEAPPVGTARFCFQTIQPHHAYPINEQFGDLGGIMALKYNPTTSTLASLHLVRKVRLWRVRAQENGEGYQMVGLRTLEHGDADWVSDMSFSPDGQHIATVCRNEFETPVIRIWRTGGLGQVVRFWAAHPGGYAENGGDIGTVCFSPDGSRLVTSGSDLKINLWDWQAEIAIKTVTMPNIPFYPSFVPNGRYIVVRLQLQETVAVLDLDLNIVKTLDPLGDSIDPALLILGMKVTPDSQSVIVGDSRRRIHFVPLDIAAGNANAAPLANQTFAEILEVDKDSSDEEAEGAGAESESDDEIVVDDSDDDGDDDDEDDDDDEAGAGAARPRNESDRNTRQRTGARTRRLIARLRGHHRMK